MELLDLGQDGVEWVLYVRISDILNIKTCTVLSIQGGELMAACLASDVKAGADRAANLFSNVFG